ncbi:uncharacterized protein LOC102802292 [Saccoglossus kowalevskii]
MDERMKEIRREYMRFVRSDDSYMKQLMNTSYFLYPEVINEAEIISLNFKRKEDRPGYVFDLFMKTEDGCSKITKILTETKKSVKPDVSAPSKSQKPKVEVLLEAIAQGQSELFQGQQEIKDEMVNFKMGQQELKKEIKYTKESVQSLRSDILKLETSMETKILSIQEQLDALKKAVSQGQKERNKINDQILKMSEEVTQLKEEYQSVIAKIDVLQQKQVATDDIFRQFFDQSKTLLNTKGDVWTAIEDLRENINKLKMRFDVECKTLQQRLEMMNLHDKGTLIKKVFGKDAERVQDSAVHFRTKKTKSKVNIKGITEPCKPLEDTERAEGLSLESFVISICKCTQKHAEKVEDSGMFEYIKNAFKEQAQNFDAVHQKFDEVQKNIDTVRQEIKGDLKSIKESFHKDVSRLETMLEQNMLSVEKQFADFKKVYLN